MSVEKRIEIERIKKRMEEKKMIYVKKDKVEEMKLEERI